jgi:hypothetical protein
MATVAIRLSRTTASRKCEAAASDFDTRVRRSDNLDALRRFRRLSSWTQPMTEWYLVWIEGLRGPEPQKWSSDALWGQLGRQDVIVRFPLTDQEARLPLAQLIRRYPAPQE